MYILGINAYHPDSSACIIKDGRIVAAVEEERFLRIKHWAGFPERAIRYCLQEAAIGLGDVDYIALNRDPRANLLKKAAFALRARPHPSMIAGRLRNITKIGGIKGELARAFSIKLQDIKAKVYYIEHHRAHLASSFFVSPFDEAAAVSVDGFGDFTSCMTAKGRSNKLQILADVNYPHSLGIFYTAFTQFLGFKKFGDEYKVMGLAAYGKPAFINEMADVVRLRPGGRFELDLSYFNFHKKGDRMLWDNAEPRLQDVFSEKLISKFGAERYPQDNVEPFHCDIAASVQAAYENVFFHILNHAHKITGSTNLCLSGGCALNSLANGRIFGKTPFEEVYIQAASSDAGGSLGAAYYLYNEVLNCRRGFVMEHAYWGPSYTAEEITAQIDSQRPALEKMGCSLEEIMDDETLCAKAARYVSEGKVVGWFQGRVEWGPRALGNRSILADPRRTEMKDILNARIKRREWFRPFAPAILLERVGEYFEISYPDPFMIKVYPVKTDKRSIIPAVTHVDGTGRLQTVRREDNRLFWQLIKEFDKITGVPVVLNTSFNENEPIVCNPAEALDCFLRTKMDILAIGRYIIKKN